MKNKVLGSSCQSERKKKKKNNRSRFKRPWPPSNKCNRRLSRGRRHSQATSRLSSELQEVAHICTVPCRVKEGKAAEILKDQEAQQSRKGPPDIALAQKTQQAQREREGPHLGHSLVRQRESHSGKLRTFSAGRNAHQLQTLGKTASMHITQQGVIIAWATEPKHILVNRSHNVGLERQLNGRVHGTHIRDLSTSNACTFLFRLPLLFHLRSGRETSYYKEGSPYCFLRGPGSKQSPWASADCPEPAPTSGILHIQLPYPSRFFPILRTCKMFFAHSLFTHSHV